MGIIIGRSENQAITSLIDDVLKDNFGSYGAPRIGAGLSKKGYRASRSRIARITRADNLFAGKKRRFRFTTDPDHNYPIAPNILNRDFTVDRENQVRVSDTTYIQTKQGRDVFNGHYRSVPSKSCRMGNGPNFKY